MDDLDRKPNPTDLDMRAEWEGEDGLIVADFSSRSVHLNTATGGNICLGIDDVDRLYAQAQKFRGALALVREP